AEYGGVRFYAGLDVDGLRQRVAVGHFVALREDPAAGGAVRFEEDGVEDLLQFRPARLVEPELAAEHALALFARAPEIARFDHVAALFDHFLEGDGVRRLHAP